MTAQSRRPPQESAPASAVLHAFAAYGLELEYMIVDADTLSVKPVAEAFLREIARPPRASSAPLGWSNELVAHVVELKNEKPCAELEPLLGGFEAEIARAATCLRRHGARLMPTGMHPWMDPSRETVLWPNDPAGIYSTYDRIFDCRSHGWANLQSMHLNLPFANDREFGRLHAAIRLLLPILPALAASSPWREARRAPGLDHRLAVYATNAAAFPTITGSIVPEAVSTRAEYEQRILAPMFEEIAPHDPQGTLRHEWLNSRGAIARFERSAIEVRVLDVQECPLADIAIAAAVTSVVKAVWEREARLPQSRNTIDTEVLAHLLEVCAKDADQAPVSDPSYLSMLGYPGRPCSAGELWRHLIDDCPPESPVHGPPFREALDMILEQGPLARRILRATGPRPPLDKLRDAYRQLCDCLETGRMFGTPS